MFTKMPSSLIGGGTIDGDLVITGDLTVDQTLTVTGNQTADGTVTVDITNTEALLVRKDADGGDIFTVDTSGDIVTVTGQLNVDNLRLDGNAITATDTNGNVTIDADGTGDLILQNTATGRVGINEADPLDLLHVTSSSGSGFIRIEAPAGSDPGFQFYRDATTQTADIVFDDSASDLIIRNDVGGANSDIVLATTDAGEVLRISGDGTVTATLVVSPSAFAVGPNGATNPTLNVNTNAASAVTGWDVIGQATTVAPSIVVTSPNANEAGAINAKGTGNLLLQETSTGAVLIGGSTQHVLAGGESTETLEVVGGGLAAGSSRGGQIDFIGGTAASTPGEIVFRAGTNEGGTAQTERWRIDDAGILESNGAQTIQTSTGILTLNSDTSVDITGSRLNVDSLRLDGGTLSSTVGGLTLTPANGFIVCGGNDLTFNSAGMVTVDLIRSTGNTSIVFRTNSIDRLTLDNTGTLDIDKTTADEGFLNFKATIDADATSAISSLTTSGAVTHHIQIELNGITAWIPVSTTDPT